MSHIIECPACFTRYKSSKAVPDGGRSVKCARCGNQWRTFPQSEIGGYFSEEDAEPGGHSNLHRPALQEWRDLDAHRSKSSATSKRASIKKALLSEHLARDIKNKAAKAESYANADIFISYSKHDPEYTVSLAEDLRVRGYTTWWDSSLLPGDEFPDLIKRKIDAAKVVIVIWTVNSVNSRWVRAEAARGDDQYKLITLSAPGLNFRDIPLPFNTLHCEPVTNREKIYAVLRERGVISNEAPSCR